MSFCEHCETGGRAAPVTLRCRPPGGERHLLDLCGECRVGKYRLAPGRERAAVEELYAEYGGGD
jgi:hypothetical protein